jgi:hypothetical protein
MAIIMTEGLIQKSKPKPNTANIRVLAKRLSPVENTSVLTWLGQVSGTKEIIQITASADQVKDFTHLLKVEVDTVVSITQFGAVSSKFVKIQKNTIILEETTAKDPPVVFQAEYHPLDEIRRAPGTNFCITELVRVANITVPSRGELRFRCAACGTWIGSTCPRKCYPEGPQMAEPHFFTKVFLRDKSGELECFMGMDALLQYLGKSQGDFLDAGFGEPSKLSGLISASLDDAEYRALISAKPARSGGHPGQKGEPIYTVERIFHPGQMPSEYPFSSESSTSPLETPETSIMDLPLAKRLCKKK